MPVKARPQPALILVPAQFLFGLLMQLLDGVPAMGLSDQSLQRGRSRQVAPIILVVLGLPTRRSLSPQPADLGFALRREPPGAHGPALLAPPALAPVPPAARAPLAPGHGGQPVVDPLGMGGIPTLRAHLQVGSHGHHIACVARLQSGQAMGVVAIVRLRDYTAMRYAPGPRLIQQRQGALGLGLA